MPPIDDKNNRISNLTLAQQIADSIALEIVDGKYKPGERLYELKLTEHFGTSRVPIREALFILEKEGVVERSPRRGVFVKNYTSKELFDLYDVIYRLEEIALKKACESILDSQIEYLKNLIGKMENEAQEKNIRAYFNVMEKLQVGFFDVNGNEVLKEVYQKLITRITRLRFMSLSHPSSLEHSVEEYKSIVDSLVDRRYDLVKFHLNRKEKRALDIWRKKGY